MECAIDVVEPNAFFGNKSSMHFSNYYLFFPITYHFLSQPQRHILNQILVGIKGIPLVHEVGKGFSQVFAGFYPNFILIQKRSTCSYL